MDDSLERNPNESTTNSILKKSTNIMAPDKLTPLSSTPKIYNNYVGDKSIISRAASNTSSSFLG
jgi:hypothetical protein